MLTGWGLVHNGEWLKDEREQQDIFDHRNMETNFSKYCYPRVENLKFYASYHGMMTVVGEWLTKYPCGSGPYNLYSDFQDFLKGHILTQLNGKWLSDLRSSVPSWLVEWKEQTIGDEAWISSTEDCEYDHALGLSSNLLHLWGSWSSIKSHKEKHINIRSALINPERAEALARALKHARPHDYNLPTADDEDFIIDENDFNLSGWICANGEKDGIDEYDPWASDVGYPPLKPSIDICQKMQLNYIDDAGAWRSGSPDIQGEIRSTAWCGYGINADMKQLQDRGNKLAVLPIFLKSMLINLNQSLIVAVKIRRDFSYEYKRGKSELGGYREGDARLFLCTADGRIQKF